MRATYRPQGSLLQKGTLWPVSKSRIDTLFCHLLACAVSLLIFTHFFSHVIFVKGTPGAVSNRAGGLVVPLFSLYYIGFLFLFFLCGLESKA